MSEATPALEMSWVTAETSGVEYETLQAGHTYKTSR